MKKAVITIVTLILFTSVLYCQNQRSLRGKNEFLNTKLEQDNKQIEQRLNPFYLQKLKNAETNSKQEISYKPLIVYIDDSTRCRTYTYDASGNLLTELWKDWENGTWVNDWKNSYAYDDNGNILTMMHALWRNETWVNYSLKTYTYDVNTCTVVSKILDKSYWEYIPPTQTTITYDVNGNPLIYLTAFWRDGIWIIFYRYTYTYDGYGNVLTELEENYSSGVWKTLVKRTINYDINENILTELEEKWQNGTWVNYLRYTYTYDENVQTELEQGWYNNAWVDYSLSIYTYDSNTNILTQVFARWLYDAWVTYFQYTYTYDENNNLIYAKAEDASSDKEYVDFTIFYNNKKDNFNVLGYNCTVQYTKFSDVQGEINNNLVFKLNQNYPNPFNPSTSINFTLSNVSFVTLTIYDILGQEVTTLIDKELKAGTHLKIWDASRYPSGVYFYKLQAGKFSETKKMILMR